MSAKTVVQNTSSRTQAPKSKRILPSHRHHREVAFASIELPFWNFVNLRNEE